MKLIFRNPCKTCIVQAACTRVCNERKKYGGKLSTTESICTFVFLFPAALVSGTVVALASNLFDLDKIPGAILHGIGIVVACIITIIGVNKIVKHFNNERKDYLNQLYDEHHTSLKEPRPPKYRRFL